eukprot:TRINITY_DN7695_c0_g1_i1.p1 TRINITY_DN7695_c0_g1~~TRINITY_DN7695_c0_g1_i1.p1  ORF type:complete len:201 (+),score=40.03 TRINITY_DN7695_c0_g1_i1:79-681(+)
MRIFVAAVVSLVACVLGTNLRQGLPSNEVDVEARLNALQPVLTKLRGLDPKTFGLLSGMISQAEAGSGQDRISSMKGASFLEYVRSDPDQVQRTLEKLAPVLDHLKGLDKRAFGVLSGLMSQVHPSVAGTEDGLPRDGGRGVQASFIQKTEPTAADVDPETSRKLEALAPVLDRLKGLDSKTFGLLSGMMVQAASKPARN